MLFETIALLLGMQAAGSGAQTPEDILVTGQRLTPETARRYVNDISRPVNGQLPMFRYPVCPEVLGMDPEHAQAVAGRIRKVVKYVGVPLGRQGCVPNLRVIVVNDSQEFVAELAKTKPGYFEGMDRSDVKRLLKDQSPALAWSNLQAQNEDGHIYADNPSGRSAFDRMHGNNLPADDPNLPRMPMPKSDASAPVMRTMSASIIKSSTQQAMLESYVVIEAPAVAGKSLMQIADYATMRALAAAQPPQDSAVVDTILSLFNEGSEAPPSVRVPDVAYLKALYSAAPTMNSVQQLNRLTKAVLDASSGVGEEPQR
jgi:hypothetical protein